MNSKIDTIIKAQSMVKWYRTYNAMMIIWYFIIWVLLFSILVMQSTVQLSILFKIWITLSFPLSFINICDSLRASVWGFNKVIYTISRIYDGISFGLWILGIFLLIIDDSLISLSFIIIILILIISFIKTCWIIICCLILFYDILRADG